MIDVRRAADRYRVETTPGVITFACFSSGPHYDPANVAFGPVLACDEHLVSAGGGFDRHPHAHVELVSLVLDGALAHEDGEGRRTLVAAGALQHQLAAARVEHAERNASTTEPLRFVQLWLDAPDGASSYEVGEARVPVRAGVVDVWQECRKRVAAAAPYVHLYVADGEYAAAGHRLAAGDSMRVRDETITVDGAGVVVVATLGS